MSTNKFTLEFKPTEELEPMIRRILREELLKAMKDRDPFAEYPEMLTRQQAAEILNVQPATVDAKARRGEIKRHGTSGSPRYSKQDLLDYLTNGNRF
jgi:hypothetical protein